MDTDRLLDIANADGRMLLAAAETDWASSVSHCPDWDAAGLVRHTGRIFTWMSAIVSSGQQVRRRDLGPAPAELAALPGWYLANLEHTLDVLGSAPPDSPTWTFSTTGDQRVAWWRRRLAVEVAIHRRDADDATLTDHTREPTPVDGEVAAAGIEEFVIEFLPGLLTQDGIEGLTGTLHLHATDGPAEWSVDLDTGTAVAGHRTADTAIRGTRSQLLLWLNNRQPAAELDIHGNRTVFRAWRQLRL